MTASLSDSAEVGALCLAALAVTDASRRVAEVLTDAALFAEDRGEAVGGVTHLLDHVDAMDHARELVDEVEVDVRPGVVPTIGVDEPQAPRHGPAKGRWRAA